MTRKAVSTRVSSIAPDLIAGQILAIGFEPIAAAQFFRDGVLVEVFLPGEVLLRLVILHAVIACHARVAFLESPRGLVNLRGGL
jgi:hypothetical protein